MALNELHRLRCRDVDLYWATLLHDVGKYQTLFHDEHGNTHYYGHELESVKIFETYVYPTLGFSKASKKKIAWLLGNHMKIGVVLDMKKAKRYRFMLHPHFRDLITLFTADNLGRDPADIECGPALTAQYETFMEAYSRTTFLTGADIMQRYP